MSAGVQESLHNHETAMARSSGDDNVGPKEFLLDRSVAKSLSDRSVTRPVSCQSLPDS